MSTPGFLEGKRFRKSRTAFRIEESKAFAKLRSFRVAHPEGWILELLLAAIASGATRVDVEPGAWSTTLRFDGERFSKKELDDLYHHLLEAGIGGQTRMAHLASGLLILSHLEPRLVRIRSGSVQVEERWDEEGEPQRAFSTCEPVAGTWVEVLKPREFAPLTWLGIRHPDDEALLRARALACPVDIRIDGARLEPTLPRHFVEVPIDDGEVTGSLGLMRDYSTSAPLHVCYRGVLVKTRTFKGVGGVLSSSAIRRNISLNDVVDDRASRRLINHARKSRPLLEADLVAQLSDLVVDTGLLALNPMVQRVFTAMMRGRKLPADHPTRALLRTLPFFEGTDGHGVSLEELEEGGEARYCAERSFLRPLEDPMRIQGQLIVLVPEPGGRRKGLGTYVFGEFEDVTIRLKRAQAKTAFLKRPEQPLTVTGRADYKVPIEVTGMGGELALSLEATTSSLVRVLYQRRSIAWIKEGLMPGVFGVVDSEDLQPTPSYVATRRDEAWDAVVAVVRIAHDRLLESALDALEQPGAAEDPERRTRLAARVVWNLVNGSEQAAWVERARSAPLFDTLAGTPLTARELLDAATSADLYAVSPPGGGSLEISLERVRELVEATVPLGSVVILNAGELKLVGEMLGDAKPVLINSRVRWANAQPRVADVVRRWPHVAAGPHTVQETDGIRALIGRAKTGSIGGGVRGGGTPPRSKNGELVWLRSGRVCDRSGLLDLPWLCPGLAGAVDNPQLRVGWQHEPHARDDETWDAARAVVEAAVESFVDAQDDPALRLALLLRHYTLVRSKPPRWRKKKSSRRPPPPQWLAKPLLPCLDGEVRPLRHVTPGTGIGDNLGYLPLDPTAPPPPMTLPDERLVLLLDETTLALLREAGLQLELMEREVRLLQKRERLSQQGDRRAPVLPGSAGSRHTVRVPGHATLGDVTGELRLGRPDEITLLYHGRVLARFESKVGWSPVQAVLNVTALDFPMDGDRLVPMAATMSVRAVVRRRAERVLVGRIQEGADPDDGRALVALLRHRSTAGGLGAYRPDRVEPWRKPLLEHPVVPRISGEPWSLQQIHERLEAGETVEYLVQPRSPGGLAQDTLFVSRDLAKALCELFPKLTDAHDRVERSRKARRLLEAAPGLDLEHAPPSALGSRRVRTKVGDHEVTGVIWVAGPDARTAMNGPGTLFVAYRGKQVYSAGFGESPFQVRAHLTTPALEMDPEGAGLVRDEALEAIREAANTEARRLVPRLVQAADTGTLSPERLVAARCVALAQAHQYVQAEGAEKAASAHPALFETPLWPRADGAGHAHLRALLEDHANDGEVGYLPGPAADPALLGEDLALVVTHPSELDVFESLFGEDGWKSYGPRLEAAPRKDAAEQVNALLKKAARLLPHGDDRARLEGWTVRVESLEGSAVWCAAAGPTVVVNDTHPRSRTLLAMAKAGQDVTVPLIAALAGRILADEPEALLSLMGALARLR